jgi:hypothetical protein
MSITSTLERTDSQLKTDVLSELKYDLSIKYTDIADDISHMQKVISYIHRHLAQRPSGDIKDTHWRFSLINWVNDPLKETS